VEKVKGSHHKMKKNDQIIVIPHHTKELKKGIQEYFLKQLKEVN